MKPERIIEQWDRIRRGLINTIDKFTDEDLDFVPFQGSFSVRDLLLHIAQEEFGEIQYGLTYKLEQFPSAYQANQYTTLESLKKLLSDVHEESVNYLGSLAAADMDTDFEAQWEQTAPLIDFIAHVMEHEVHHRGELSLMLGLLGREGLDA